MGLLDEEAHQQRSLALAFQRADLTVEELWTRYFAIGGDADPLEVEAYLDGLAGLPTFQRDVLAHAVNERIEELTWAHPASYSRSVRDDTPDTGPLAALVALLEGTEQAPPERLPALAEAAGHILGTQFTIYLVDYDQRFLHPVPVSGSTEDKPALEVDTTLAGRVFRQVEILSADHGEQGRLWMPLLDGVERLGVLEVEVSDVAELHDPGLRKQCKWVSLLVGHLVVLMGQYGDVLELVRLRVPRTVAGELIWSLLPPLTAGVDSFVVSGVVEPRHEVAGDAFDYSLSETTATLMILDAVGHDLRSGLIAATALAAHRNARRAGHGLYEQARIIDETIVRQFGEAAFATAVLAEVDLRLGRLRYLNAGHPRPLLMRAGKVVKPLDGGRRIPLGLGGGDVSIAEEWLQPDDWLMLYTDGITEARDAAGEFFGDARLADFLQREAAAGYPPPETTRRLIQAVLAHQHGRLQDDATVLLARWTSSADVLP